MHSDSALLFGLLALQCGFISKEQLVAAMAVWTRDKHQSLEMLLHEQKAITPHQQALLKQVEREVLAQHQHSAPRSLAALSSIGSVRQDLESLADAELIATIAHVAPDGNSAGTSALAIEGSGTKIGREGALRYRTIRLHAKGGLGEVYLAKDQELNREVALKEIQARFADQDESRARFRLEAEITGNLEHPGIVPVYGLGQYGDGRPYYAMRFIRGESLKDAIDAFHEKSKARLTEGEAGLELRKLLRRFVDVCNAMEYAHSRGVLHRDLKPANIILGKYGETLVVDWGLAKVNASSGITGTPLEPVVLSSGRGATTTLVGFAVGTPAYMSPEQAAGKVNELSSATDVYSLGATLFHLLTGHLPIAGRSPVEMVKFAEAGEIRRPRDFRPDVPKSLEAVCLKAMAKEPGQRYSSPRALADDIEHWLADESVSCLADPLSVRVRRWTKRHRTLVTSSAAAVGVLITSLAVLLALVAGHNRTLDATNRQLDQANSGLQEANAAERGAKQDADQKRIDAENAQGETKQVLDYLVAAFRKPDPDADGEKLTVAELFDEAVEQVQTSFPDQPLIQAKLLSAIGQTYDSLGLFPKAVAVHERARDLRRTLHGEDHEDTLASMSELAAAYQHAGRTGDAIPLSERTLELKTAKLGVNHEGTLVSMNDLAVAYLDAGNVEKAVQLLEETLKLKKANLGPSHRSTLATMSNLALAYRAAGKVEQAVSFYEAVLELSKATVDWRNTDTLMAMHSLAAAYQYAGNTEKALPLLEEARRQSVSTFGPDHPETLATINSVATAYRSAGKLEKALPLFEENLRLAKAKFGPEHPKLLAAMNNLALAYLAARDLERAVPLLVETLKLGKERLGPGHPETLKMMNNLAQAYGSAGRLEEAIQLSEETILVMQGTLGKEHPETLSAMAGLAYAYRLAGQPEQALPLYEETVKLMIAQLGPDHINTMNTMSNLAKAYLVAGLPEKALPLYEQTVTLMRAKLGPEHPSTRSTMGTLADACLNVDQPEKALTWFDQYIECHRATATPEDPALANELAWVSLQLLRHRQYPAAETRLRECLLIREKLQPEVWTTFNTKSLLGSALLGQEQYSAAEPLLLAGFEGLEKRKEQIPPPGKVRLPEAAQFLVVLYTALEKPEEAAKWQSKLEALQKELTSPPTEVKQAP